MNGKKLGSRSRPKPKKLTEADYIIPAADAQGKSGLVQFRSILSHLRQAEIVCSAGKFPFKTPSDLFRWCLWYGLGHLTAVEPPDSSVITYSRMETQRLKDAIYIEEQAATSELMEFVVTTHLKEGTPANEFYALGLVMKGIEDARHIKDKMWREKTVKGYEKRFAGLLGRRDEIIKAATAKVSLNPLDLEEDEGEETENDEEV